ALQYGIFVSPSKRRAGLIENFSGAKPQADWPDHARWSHVLGAALVTRHTKFHVASGFPEQCVQSKAQQFARSTGDGLPIRRFTGLQTSKTLHEIKGRAVDLNGINCSPATEPIAPTSGISGAPLLEAGSSFDHGRCTPAA